MRIMRRVDPEGVQFRKRNRLKRRLYRSKVYSMLLAIMYMIWSCMIIK